ncbi:transaldolase family protein [Mesoaciditoga sp.]
MRFYVDSANLKEIEKAISLRYVEGVTTNPSLLRRERIWESFESIEEFYSKLMNVCDGEIFAQIPSSYIPEFLRKIKRMDTSRFVVKVPSVPAGLKIASELKEKGYKICATAVYTSSQALMWDALGVDYIAIYIDRMKKRGFNVFENVSSILKALENGKTKVLAASVKDVEELTIVMNLKIEHMTLNYKMIEDITKCSFSIEDTKIFDNDFEVVKEHFYEDENR